MSEIKARTVEEIPYYQGPNAIPGIRFRMAARELGVTAWGMGVLEIDTGCVRYPEHDHERDGQEEVYVVLRGDGTMDVSGEKNPLSTGMLVRVGPTQKRKILPGPQGITVLAIGATPVVGDVSHQALFRRLAAVVHHGGAGTTASAARAGVPQVMVPMFGDQFYWASRVRALGIGSSAMGTLTTECLTTALREGIESAIADRSRSFARQLRADGAMVAARRLVNL